MDSQIDFSIFQHYSPNTQWSLSPLNMQTNENDHSIVITSSLDTVEIPDTLTLGNHGSHLEEETFMELDKNENTTFCNSIENHGDKRSVKESSHSKEYDFEEVDSIFRKIEFISNLEFSHINKLDSPDCIARKYQTQLQLKADLNISNKKVIASCPAHTEKQLLACRSTEYKKLYTNNSISSTPQNVFAETVDTKTFRSINTATNLCLSFDKHFNDNAVEVDDIFKEPVIDSELIFGCQDSGQSHSQAHIETNLRHLFDENISKDKSQPFTTANNSANINMMVNSSSVPFSVRQLYDIVKTNYSDFAFIYALSSQLCQDRVPMECFVTLKIALLLSLVSIGNNEDRSPIPIVAMTNDTYMTDYLMTNVGQLGSRFLGPVDETKSFSNMNWIEADSILLTRGGVYYAGDWTRLKLRKAETIFKNIECSRVTVEKSTLSFPLKTAIWTHWRSFKNGAKDQQMFNKFLKIFGIPIFVSDDNHEALIDYILEQSSIRTFESTVDHLSITEDDMRSFLVYVSQHNVELSPEAAVLLKNYFVTSRSKRQDCLSKQSYTMLKQFAESFAKLSMRNVVLSDDALAAIIMCEHFIENIFSPTDKPRPHFGNFTFVGAVDKYLTHFKEWLDSYVEHFTNE